MSNINIFSYNVNGISGTDKRKAVFQWLKTQNADICLLQEVHFKQSEKEKWKQEWDGEMICSGNSKNQMGVSILFRNGLNVKLIETYELEIGRLLAVKCKIEDKEIVLINIYGPNKDEIDLFQKLENFIKDKSEQLFITGGDFNLVLDPDIDKQGGNPKTHIKCRKKLKEIIETYELSDIYRIRNPLTKRFTWRSKVHSSIV